MQKEKAQGGILYGIGVGPGEPELLTHKAVQVIECCDTIVVPSEPIEECNAFQIVEKLVPDIRKHQLVAWNFPMTRDEKKLEEGCLFNAGGSGNLFHLYLSFTENRRAWWPYGNG